MNRRNKIGRLWTNISDLSFYLHMKLTQPAMYKNITVLNIKLVKSLFRDKVGQ